MERIYVDHAFVWNTQVARSGQSHGYGEDVEVEEEEEVEGHHLQAQGVADAPLTQLTNVMNVVEEVTMHMIVLGIEEKTEKERAVIQRGQGQGPTPDQEAGAIVMERPDRIPDLTAGHQ